MPVTVVLLASLFLAGCGNGVHRQPDPDEDGAQPVVVQAEPARIVRMERTVRAIGTCTPLPTHQVVIAPVVEGIVTEIVVREGDVVQAGQPLVRLDDRLTRRELAERKAAQAEWEAARELLKTPPRREEQRVADLEVERAKVTVELVQATLDRLVPLHRRKEISDQQLYEVQQRLRDAALALQAAEGRRTVLMLPPKPEAVAEAEAKIARAEAAVETVKTRLGYFTLTSPRAGVVEKVNVRLGELMAVGAAAAEVLDTSELFVTVGVRPRDAALLRKDEPARVLAQDAEPGESAAPLVGKVVFVGAEANADTGMVPVRVLASNPEARLRLQTVVLVEIVVALVEDALAVPDAALVSLQEGPTLVLVRDGKAELLHPQIGVRQHGLTQVSAEGLKAGDLVVTRGGYNLPEGTPVKVSLDRKASGDTKP